VTKRPALPDAVAAPTSGTAGVNEVHLVGRVSSTPEERALPSGDCVILFRLVVPRAPGRAGAATVDTIDIACWSARARRSAARLRPDDVAEIEGSLRRRFFNAGGGPASRYEVEARAVRRASTRTDPRD